MDKQQLKPYLASYLSEQGIDISKPFQCLNPSHADTHPSMRYDPRRHKAHCFACGVDYDLLDIIAIDYRLPTMGEAFQKAGELYGKDTTRHPKKACKPKPDPAKPALPPSPGKASDYLLACQARLTHTGYFTKRGLSLETARRFGLGYDPAFPVGGDKSWQALILPTGPDSYLARNTEPDTAKDQRIRKRGSGGLYIPEGALQKDVPLLVTEGELDALSVWEAGYPAIALGSCANAGKLAQLVKSMEHPPPLLLALDDDEAGRKAAAGLLEALEGSNAACLAADICLGQKDPNAALMQDREGFRQAIERAQAEMRDLLHSDKKAYLSSSSAAHLDAFFHGIADSVDTPVQGTGFAALDSALDGGLYEGLYIVGAITSLGKTTLVCQMADQIAQSGRDVLIFSLEMSRHELMAKSISRLTLAYCLENGLGTACAKTTRGITTGRRYLEYRPVEHEVIQRAMEAYRTYAERVFIQEGMGDIGVAEVRRTVRHHMDLTGQAPVVIIDYLQILAPCHERATDKQNTDKAVLELKRISRDCKLPVIGISSFNRAGYSQAVTMEAFKESGAIEYSSDVLIGLQLKGASSADFDATCAKRQDPRQVELVVLKNRNGRVGERVSFSYYPLFNTFKETGA